MRAKFQKNSICKWRKISSFKEFVLWSLDDFFLRQEKHSKARRSSVIKICKERQLLKLYLLLKPPSLDEAQFYTSGELKSESLLWQRSFSRGFDKPASCLPTKLKIAKQRVFYVISVSNTAGFSNIDDGIFSCDFSLLSVL